MNTPTSARLRPVVRRHGYGFALLFCSLSPIASTTAQETPPTASTNPASGADGYTYWKARTTLDENVTYRLTRRFSLFGSARNILNVTPVHLRYSSATPEYARVNRRGNYGVKFSAGVKGSF